MPPEIELVNLIRRETGVIIDSMSLRWLIKRRWAEIAKLAHAIHEGRT